MVLPSRSVVQQPVFSPKRSNPKGPTLTVYVAKQGRQPFAVSELVCLQSDQNYTWLCWADGKRILMPRTLKYVESCLPGNSFVRLHRQHTVNVNHVVSLHKIGDELMVGLSDGQSLVVARRRRRQVRKQLEAVIVRRETGIDEKR